MRGQYFIFDGESDVLQRSAQSQVENAWECRKQWDSAGGTRNLGIVTVLSDDELRPENGFHPCVQVTGGWITREVVFAAVNAWLYVRPSPGQPNDEPGADLRPEMIYQRQGWPEPTDLHRQLAVALDVPITGMPPLYFGGPLLANCQLDVSVKQAHTYFVW